MAEVREKRYEEEDDDLQELKPRSRRRDDEDEEQQPRRKRRAVPVMKTFTVMYNFGKYYSTCEYEAPEGFTPADVDEFIYEQKQDGEKVFEPRQKKDRERDSRGYSNGYSRGGRYESRRRYDD